jgi:hypothetical protein
MIRSLVVCIFIFLFCTGQVPLEPLSGRLIHLEVEGSRDVENMLKNFLTGQGFIFVDDKAVPVLKFAAFEKKGGPYYNRKVTYGLDHVELMIPGIGTRYPFSSPKAASDSGVQREAEISALTLLKMYLSNDNTFMSELENIRYEAFYRIQRQEPADPSDLDQIKQMLRLLMDRQDPVEDILRRLQNIEHYQTQIEYQQTSMSVQIERLADAIHSGSGRISEAAVKKLNRLLFITEKELFERNLPCHFSGDCPETDLPDDRAVGVILIKVPLRQGQSLEAGAVYKIFAENYCLVYERPRVAVSLERLMRGSLGNYFLERNYIEIDALYLRPEDRAVIIRNDGAKRMFCMNRSLERISEIFNEGNVVIIPDS